MNTSPSQYAIIFAWLLCSIMFNTGTSSFNIRCNQKDKQALLNIKQGIMDPSGVLSSWSTQQDCCQWIGVNCDNITSRVTELSLPCSTTLPTYTDKIDKSLCLTGSIYLSLLLLEFEFLNHLDLSNNDFLAIQFDSMHDQNCHNLSIAIAPRLCLNSTTLHYLDLSNNENLVMNSLLWLSRMSSLEYLDLSGIDLHKETEWLQFVTMLPSLSELHMGSCHLKDLSPSLQYANFTALKVLDLFGNEFHSELPKWLFNLSSGVSDIYLSWGFSLTGQLPKALLNLRYLEVLDLEANDMDGPIPYWLGELEHLQYLNLKTNKFSGSIPSNLGNLSSLTDLLVGHNQLSGVVSEKNFAKLSKLRQLDMQSSPPLIFDFDSHWVPPFQLERLALGFAGSNLPEWLYTQRSIEKLAIYESSFEAPGKFWNFVSKVEQLYLLDNAIDGNMSNVLLNSTFVYLSSNEMKGGLPRLTSNVAFLDISNNSLSGNISPLLCDDKMLNRKRNLEYLDISHNHLTGGLTNCWRNWKSLVRVSLGRNNLTGQIPRSMGLSNLTSLHLHENRLYGEIPLSLQNCHSLLIFNVRENNFSGNIPNWMPHGTKVFLLRSNNFSGNIPKQICQMSSLILLDIADNRISGHIPTCIQNITTLVFNNASYNKLTYFFPVDDTYYYIFEEILEVVTKGQILEYGMNLHFVSLIDMSRNNLSGTIPLQMFSLIGLYSLNLSYNKLTGQIPNEIGNMKKLESLDLSANQLWGEIPQSLSSLSFLGYLNVSSNNLTGKIPSGTQLQGFTAMSYMGNPELCGPPLTKLCLQDGKLEDTKTVIDQDIDGDESEFLPWFYIGIESGYVTGFLGVCCAIFLNRKWRHAYFKFLYEMKDRLLYVMLIIKVNCFRTLRSNKLHNHTGVPRSSKENKSSSASGRQRWWCYSNDNHDQCQC